MACCAFIAFLIGQGLALLQLWRERVAWLFGVKVEGGSKSAPRWRKGLLAALVIELGFVAGCAIGAGFVQGASNWTALCGTAIAAPSLVDR